jgi:hypothetical protein
MDETRYGGVFSGNVVLMCMIRGKCADLRAKVVEVSALPTGCATRCISAIMWLESILLDSPASRRQRYFSSFVSKKARALNEPVGALQHKSTSRCASRGLSRHFDEARLLRKK